MVSPDFLELHDLVGPTKTKTLSSVAAIFDVGCFFGAILAFTAGDVLGRKKGDSTWNYHHGHRCHPPGSLI